MKVELEIRSILKSGKDTQQKVRGIRKIVDWDATKLKDSIEAHGTSRNEQRNEIIKDFWGESKR